MQTQVSVDASTVQATVAILEDHDETVRCICKELEEGPAESLRWPSPWMGLKSW